MNADVGVGRVLREHTGQISALDFSHDGEFLATAGDDHRLCVYSCQHGTLNKVVNCRRHGVRHVRFTHDQRSVVVATNQGESGEVSALLFLPSSALADPLCDMCLHSDSILVAARRAVPSLLQGPHEAGRRLGDVSEGRSVCVRSTRRHGANMGLALYRLRGGHALRERGRTARRLFRPQGHGPRGCHRRRADQGAGGLACTRRHIHPFRPRARQGRRRELRLFSSCV